MLFNIIAVLYASSVSPEFHQAMMFWDIHLLRQAVRDKNVNLNQTSHWGRTPLYCAVQANKMTFLNELLRLGACPNTKETEPPLVCAADNLNLIAIAILLRAGAAVDQQDKWGETAMMKVASKGCMNGILCLYGAGARISKKDRHHQTALWYAAAHGHASAVELLIQLGCQIESPNDCQMTPLWIASCNGYGAVVEILCQYGANPNTPDDRGRTPLQISNERRWKTSENIASVLLKAGGQAVVNLQQSNQTNLHKQAEHGDIQHIDISLT